MHVSRFERAWLTIGMITMAAFFVTVLVLAVVADLNPPSEGTTIDPAKVAQTPPFDKPGLRQTGPQLYEAYYVARIFQWTPRTISVPVGSTVRFFIAPVDVVHGFSIPNADVNVELMPGWVSNVEKTFKKPGTYLIVCNQYCGSGHAGMYGTIEVTP